MVVERPLGNLKGSTLPCLQLPRMTSSDNLARKKLIIKICSKGVRGDSENKSRKHDEQSVSGDENKMLNTNASLKLPVQGQEKKRGPDEMLSGPNEKRRKMDRRIRQQCSGILKELMTHKYGLPFNEPVDPVAFNIPDYFSIISNPMDLGTIRTKLENDVYGCADEFAVDVRLTFSNCMLYNPSHNLYHCMAKDLNTYFNRRWKLMEAKLKHESKNVEQGSVSDKNGDNAQVILQMNHRTMSLVDKQNLSKELKRMLSAKMSENLQSFLKKYNLCSLKQIMDVDINTIDDEILWELKKMVKSSLNSTPAKLQCAKMAKSDEQPLSRIIDKVTDNGSRISCGSSDAKPSISSVDCKCDSCGHVTCRCSLRDSKSQSSPHDLTSERALPQHCGISRSDPDSNGAGNVIEDSVCVSSGFSVCGSTSVADEGGTPLVDVQLSPKKALRAAMLKSRFADTIFKARQKTLLDQCKSDAVKLQLEKERLDKRQHEDKPRIKAEAASLLRAEADLKRQREKDLKMQREKDLKMQREKEREAARIALQQMEKTVEIEDNLKILKELEILRLSAVADYPLAESVEMELDTTEGGYGRNPLEQLGLYFKEDFIEDDDELYDEEAISNGDREEGEI